MPAEQINKGDREIVSSQFLKRESFFSQRLILIISLILIGCIFSLNIYTEYNNTFKREQERLHNKTKILQKNIEQNLIATRDVLVDLRKYVPENIAGQDLIDRLQILTNALPGVRTIGITDASGIWLASNRKELIGKNFGYRDYFKIPKQHPDEKILYLTPPYISSLGVATISVSIVITGPRGEFSGVIMAALEPNYFSPLLESVLYAQDMWVGIAHWDGIIFMIRPEMNKLSGNTIQSDSFFYHHKGSGKEYSVFSGTANATGDDRLIIIRTINPAGLNIPAPLVVAASRNRSSLLINWRNDSIKIFSLYAFLVLISIFGFTIFNRRQRQFIRQAAEAANALEQSEERFRSLFLNNHASLLVIDPDDGSIIDANPAACRYYGYLIEDMIKKKITDINILTSERIAEEMENAKSEKRGHFFFYHRLSNGEIRPVEVYSGPIEYRGKILLYSIIHDITDRKKAEDILQKSEKKYRDLYQGSRDGYVLVDMAGIILEYNSAYKLMLGYTDEELVLKTYTDLTPVKWHAMEKEIVENQVIPHNYSSLYEKEYIRKDGKAFPVELRTYLVRDENNFPQYMWAFVRDITERKQIEEKIAKFTAELERSNNELDSFAYIASHDLKEPLRGIYNYSNFLLEDYADKLDDSGKEKLNTLVFLTRRMEGFINDLLKFSRISRVAFEMKEIKIDDIVKESLAILQITLEKGNVKVDIPRPLPAVECDNYQIAEVFQNLISNAVKYNDKAEKRIEINYMEDAKTANKYIFYVRDNGIGIDKKYFDSIFKIFKRLHARDKFGGGSGAGLTIVKKIIERHGGKIWLESTPEEGTVFYFTLQGEQNDQ